jgi:hypothetical protein
MQQEQMATQVDPRTGISESLFPVDRCTGVQQVVAPICCALAVLQSEHSEKKLRNDTLQILE